jgi:hypothetical protein
MRPVAPRRLRRPPPDASSAERHRFAGRLHLALGVLLWPILVWLWVEGDTPRLLLVVAGGLWLVSALEWPLVSRLVERRERERSDGR